MKPNFLLSTHALTLSASHLLLRLLLVPTYTLPFHPWARALFFIQVANLYSFPGECLLILKDAASASLF